MKFNMQGIMEQAQKMQEEVERVKEEASRKRVTADAGGGMVSVVMTGANELVEIKIAKELINPDEVEMLEDLIIAAVNKANNNAKEMFQEDMQKVTGMLPNIPGLNFGL